MYETLMMLIPGQSYDMQDMENLLHEVVSSGDGTLEVQNQSFLISAGPSYLQIDYNDDDYVIEESDEIATEFNLQCSGARQRFEMNGDDPNMDLFNDYLLINEKLQATGRFCVFDQQEGKEFGT